jgi:hypothetical protein
MCLGGPVWHASAAPYKSTFSPSKHELRALALKALEGVGDASLGQWEEWTGKAFHVRRRLSAEEQKDVGPVVDVRGTQEAFERAIRARKIAPYIPIQMIQAEL